MIFQSIMYDPLMQPLSDDLDVEIANSVDELLIQAGGEEFKKEWHADFVRYALEAERGERLFEVAKTDERVKRVLHELLTAITEAMNDIGIGVR